MLKTAKGFTLLELMIVVGIIAATVAVVAPRMGGRNNAIKACLRDLTVLSRQLHMKAKLTGTTYRIVFDLKDGASGKYVQGYWVEHSNGSTVVKPGEEKIQPEKDKDGKEIIRSDFTPDTSIFKEPKTLPTGLHLEKVELSRLPDAITTGKAFIHYMPQGLVEEAAIHLTSDAGGKWTIAIHPLTGKAEIITDSMSLQDLRKQ